MAGRAGGAGGTGGTGGTGGPPVPPVLVTSVAVTSVSVMPVAVASLAVLSVWNWLVMKVFFPMTQGDFAIWNSPWRSISSIYSKGLAEYNPIFPECVLVKKIQIFLSV